VKRIVGLPRTVRLRDDAVIASFRAAPRRRGLWFQVRTKCNEAGYPRLVVRVAKRVIKTAVGRNRIKRCVREVFRLQRPALTPCDFLVSLVGPYEEPSLAAARHEVERLLHGKRTQA